MTTNKNELCFVPLFATLINYLFYYEIHWALDLGSGKCPIKLRWLLWVNNGFQSLKNWSNIVEFNTSLQKLGFQIPFQFQKVCSVLRPHCKIYVCCVQFRVPHSNSVFNWNWRYAPVPMFPVHVTLFFKFFFLLRVTQP